MRERFDQIGEGAQETVCGAQGVGGSVIGGCGLFALGETGVANQRAGFGEGGSQQAAEATQRRQTETQPGLDAKRAGHGQVLLAPARARAAARRDWLSACDSRSR